MADITFIPAEITPHRLSFLCRSVPDGAAPQVVTGVIPNPPLGAGAGLSSLAALFNGSPMLTLVNVGVTNQAAARKRIFGDGDVSNPSIESVRAWVTLTPRNTMANMPPWQVDADLGAGLSAGRPVIVVAGPNPPVGPATNDLFAILTIHFRHTRRR